MINKLEKEFLKESNAIEGVYDDDSLRYAERAWETVKKIKGDLSIVDVLEIHQILMQDLNPRIAGKFRNCAVRIGGRICKQEPEAVLANKVFNVIEVINNAKKPSRIEAVKKSSKEDRIIEAKLAHVVFEDVHPFEDGNGRTGRILYNLHRQRLGLPIHVIHADLEYKGWEGEQRSYYQWFK